MKGFITRLTGELLSIPKSATSSHPRCAKKPTSFWTTGLAQAAEFAVNPVSRLSLDRIADLKLCIHSIFNPLKGRHLTQAENLA